MFVYKIAMETVHDDALENTLTKSGRHEKSTFRSVARVP